MTREVGRPPRVHCALYLLARLAAIGPRHRLGIVKGTSEAADVLTAELERLRRQHFAVRDLLAALAGGEGLEPVLREIVEAARRLCEGDYAQLFLRDGELFYAHAEAAHVVAVDASPWMLEFARERFSHLNVTFVQADAVNYTPGEPVDVAILSNVLEHIEPRIELLRSLRERAGARRLLIRVPARERDWTVPLRQEVGLPHFSDPEHKLEYDPQLLRDELAEAGWQMGEPQLNWGEIWVEASAR